MKIALVTNTFLPIIGGGEFVVHHLANHWIKRGHEVCVFNSLTNEVAHPEALYSVKRYKIMRGSTRFGYHRFPWLNVSVKSLNRLINDYSPDCISGHFAYPVGLYLSKLKSNKNWIITCHGGDIVANSIYSQRDRYKIDCLLLSALNHSKYVVSICPLAEESVGALGLSREKIRYIPNGVEFEKFKVPVSMSFREKCGLPDNSEYILTIGRNYPEKNLEFGIQSFAELSKSFPDLYYIVIGYNANKLYSIACKYGVNSKVVLIDRLLGTDIIAAYQQASVFLSPSVCEFCPLVILESMAAGLPQVATNVSGNRDFIIDGVTGILTELNNYREMASSISTILLDRELRENMKKKNFELAGQYSWNAIGDKYLELLEDC